MTGPLSLMSASDLNKANAYDNVVTGKDNIKKSSLVELKNGKVIFKQKYMSFDKLSETLQEIVTFREMLEQRLERHGEPLTAFPEEYKPLIAKLAHESDKTLPALTKHILQELLPVQDEHEISSGSGFGPLPFQAVETAIKSILNRNNYGVELASGGTKVPASLCVWRWELKEQYWDWLPKAAKGKAASRLAERIQAKKDLAILLESLSLEERDSLLPQKTGKSSSIKAIDSVAPENDLTQSVPNVDLLQSVTPRKLTDGADVNNVSSLNSCAEKPEKASKEKDKLDKKAAKADKEKKVKEAQDKSRSILANFFAKPKLAPKTSKALEATSGPSEFDKTFRPFALKKDAEVAPLNWFVDAKKRATENNERSVEGEIIVIDDEDDNGTVNNDIILGETPQFVHVSDQERLKSVLTLLPRATRPLVRPPRTSQFKTASPICVRTLISELSEAEIAGSTSRVRKILAKLSSRTLIPVKVLIYHEDTRPGYFGTWTRSSRVVGPRTPFAKDVVVLDYNYDSGEEWEAEDGNGDVDDVDGDDDDADAADDTDSDLDSWLAADDEIVEVEGQDGELGLPSVLQPLPAPKRKLDERENAKKLEKKRKVIIPLVPFVMGPCWEASVGKQEVDAFTPYKIHLFNDTLFPIDPFTFVSSAQDKPRLQPPSNDHCNTGIFRVPQLPDRLTAPNTLLQPSPHSSLPPKRAPLPPKTSFPEAHLPVLLSKIRSLATGNLLFLVESVYQELRDHKIKKNAIEAKIREVGEKCKDKRVWLVRDDVTVARGLVP